MKISAKVPTLSDKMAKEEEEVRKPGSMVAKRQRVDNLWMEQMLTSHKIISSCWM